MSDVLSHRVVRDAGWVEPVMVAAGLAADGTDGLLALISGGGSGERWSHVAVQPDRVQVGPVGEAALFDALRDPAFSAGTVGLAAYDAGARAATGPREAVWPDLMLARYPAMLTFDHQARRLQATGRGATAAQAEAAADRALGWLTTARADPKPVPPAETFSGRGVARSLSRGRDGCGEPDCGGRAVPRPMWRAPGRDGWGRRPNRSTSLCGCNRIGPRPSAPIGGSGIGRWCPTRPNCF